MAEPAFRELGRRLSNWGRWGDDDRVGTLNLITDQAVLAAAHAVRRGTIVDLGIALAEDGPQLGTDGRTNPIHRMSIMHGEIPLPGGLSPADDMISMPLQAASHWDGFAHIGYDGRLYNDVPTETVTAVGRSTVHSAHHLVERGVVGRGVLLDVAAARQVDTLAAGDGVSPDDLAAAERRQGVVVGAGDVLLVRTGWLRHHTVHGDPGALWLGEPGLTLDCAEWLHDRGVAAVAADNWGVEVVEPDPGMPYLPLHAVLLRDMGMPLGEMLDLETLARDCAADRAWDFLFCAPPLKVIGSLGAPITPVAIR